MNLKYSTKKILLTALIVLSLSACFDKENEEDIPLSAVPENIVIVIQNTLPGIVLKEAEKETKKDVVIYELEGKMIDGRKYEIKISADGTIIKIELED